MKYYTLSADYLDVSIVETAMGRVEINDLAVSPELRDAVVNWNERYQTIIPMEMSERSLTSNSVIINELDKEGLELADRIKSELPEEVKVGYYSEGRLTRIVNP